MLRGTPEETGNGLRRFYNKHFALKEKIRMGCKMCFVSDDDAHWYCIPVDDKELFYQWLDGDDENFDFNECRLNMHISNYCFENFSEIKKD